MSNPLNEFGEKIFLDRYAMKDTKKETLTVGDTVVVCVNQKTRQREIGIVKACGNRGEKVEIELRDGTVSTYAWDDVDKPLELKAEQAVARTARGVAEVELPENREVWTKNFEWLMDDWRFVPGGRILAAAGTDQLLSLFNCYVIASPKDSRRGILDTLAEMTEIMSRGGGVGINLSTLRPHHTYVKGVNGRSSGSVSWGGLYSFTTGLIEQGGSRRGALMLVLNDWHPDLIDFINAKREAGRITNANISVGISDDFMAAVKADADWTFEFPETTSALYEEKWDGDLKAWKALGGATVVYKTMKAKEIWDMIIASAWASAEPGVLFIERYNKMSNSRYFSKIVATNPCWTGDMRVALADGRGTRTWKELAEAGRDVDVIARDANGVPVVKRMRNPRVTAQEAGVFKVVLSNGAEFKVTGNHKMTLSNLDVVRVDELNAGERLWIGKRSGNSVASAYAPVAELLAELDETSEQGYESKVVDGTRFVKKTCEVCGAQFWVEHDKREVSFCGDSCVNEYESRPTKVIVDPGLGLTVVSVEYAGLETVYNGTVDDVHNVCVSIDSSADGIETLLNSPNCGEQGLPAYGCCNLGALNLSRFVTKKAKKHVVDWENLGKAVEYAVRFLDNVVDLNFYFMDSIGEQQLGERRVGLGIMGLAEMLVRLELRYGSTQGNEFIDELGKFIAMTAYRASADLAVAKGAFPKYDPEQIMESGFIQSLPAETQAVIKANGLRNVTLLTVAPTGTTGTMVNTSTGVEPYFSWSYFRTSRLGVHEETVDVAAEWKAANPGKDLPKWFVNAMDLTPEEHVTVQAKLQRWIDSSISKTCNVQSDYTIDQTRELYELMYELGCKGGTIYRDGSRDEQVLSTAKPGESEKKDEKKEDKKAAKKEIKLRERPRMARGLTIEKDSPVGRVFVTVNVDNSGNPIEIFVTAGKAGSDVTSMAEGIGRACSFALQLAGPMTSMERLSEIAEQFTGIGGTNVVGIGKNQIRSLPEAVAKAIEEIAEEIIKMQTSGELEPQIDPEPVAAAPRRKGRAAKTADICPVCGAAAFIREEGCQHCTACGHSRC